MDWDDAPYSMIGTMTTLPGRSRKRNNPIGFIWPKHDRNGRKAKETKQSNRRNPRR